ncbi:MAG: LapA family protein [Krumholzibacteria bacterium]|nr:LapA family protein [Candidatus Krumholzibacteria bacterium]
MKSWSWKQWLGLAVAFLVLVFAVQNTAVATIRFLFWSVSMSMVLMVVLLFGAGLAVGWLLAGARRRRGAS